MIYTNMIPSKLCCKVTYSGKPIKGLMLISLFGVKRKNAYSIVFGPTNSTGMTEITKQLILDDAKEQLECAMMDYEPLEGSFTGEITVSIMHANEIKNALQAYETYHEYYSYPANYDNILRSCLKLLQNINPNNLLLTTYLINESDISIN